MSVKGKLYFHTDKCQYLYPPDKSQITFDEDTLPFVNFFDESYHLLELSSIKKTYKHGRVQCDIPPECKWISVIYKDCSYYEGNTLSVSGDQFELLRTINFIIPRKFADVDIFYVSKNGTKTVEDFSGYTIQRNLLNVKKSLFFEIDDLKGQIVCFLEEFILPTEDTKKTEFKCFENGVFLGLKKIALRKDVPLVVARHKTPDFYVKDSLVKSEEITKDKRMKITKITFKFKHSFQTGIPMSVSLNIAGRSILPDNNKDFIFNGNKMHLTKIIPAIQGDATHAVETFSVKFGEKLI